MATQSSDFEHQAVLQEAVLTSEGWTAPFCTRSTLATARSYSRFFSSSAVAHFCPSEDDDVFGLGVALFFAGAGLVMGFNGGTTSTGLSMIAAGLLRASSASASMCSRISSCVRFAMVKRLVGLVALPLLERGRATGTGFVSDDAALLAARFSAPIVCAAKDECPLSEPFRGRAPNSSAASPKRSPDFSDEMGEVANGPMAPLLGERRSGTDDFLSMELLYPCEEFVRPLDVFGADTGAILPVSTDTYGSGWEEELCWAPVWPGNDTLNACPIRLRRVINICKNKAHWLGRRTSSPRRKPLCIVTSVNFADTFNNDSNAPGPVRDHHRKVHAHRLASAH